MGHDLGRDPTHHKDENGNGTIDVDDYPKEGILQPANGADHTPSQNELNIFIKTTPEDSRKK